MNRLKVIAIILLCLLARYSYAQQIQIDDGFTEQQLVEDYLVQGCVEISNIESPYNGNVNNINSFGYFEKGASDFPFNNGIMLTTGRAVSGANGENNSILNEGESSWLTDPDLENTLGISGTLNATSVEFDFISISNQISFNYILASEEYFGNFPCEYSDGFALLIKRADVNEPYRNIAVVPGTNIPVNTNTVHEEIVGFCDAENDEYFEGYSLGDTNYNGRTTVLTASAAIEPNVKYHIKLVIADQTDKNYDSAVFIEGNSFSASVDLGEDVTSCAESFTLNGDIGNDDAQYAWFRNGSQIENETTPVLNINESGTYKIEVTLPFLDGFCTIEDSIEMNLSSTQTAEPITDYLLCDEGNDDTETFDLSIKTDEILASVPDSQYDISYHQSLLDAENNTNPITQAIQNSTNPRTIHVRIRDIINGCLAYSTFDLIVNDNPEIDDIYDYYACDDGLADGITAIDFEDLSDELTNGNEDLVTTFYLNLNDAENEENALELPYTNSTPTETLYASVTNSVTGCTSTASINLEVKGNPILNMEPIYIDACDQDMDGFAIFDLNSVISEITQDQPGVSVSFHEFLQDAESGLNAIADPGNYNNMTKSEQDIYIRVQDELSGCASVRKFEIHSNLLLTATDIREYALCDSGDDNFFNLEVIASIIANEIDDVSIDFFETESERDSNVNPIDQTVGYVTDELPKVLFITLTSPTCQEFSEITLTSDPVYDFSGVRTLNFCDIDQDGSAIIALSQFDETVLNGQEGFEVRYYATQEDAEARQNRLPNEYQNISNPQTIYVRISASESLCYDVLDFELNLLGAPDVLQPTDITVCTTGSNTATIDLAEKIPEIVEDPTDKIIKFYSTFEGADNDIDQIDSPREYSTDTREIFVRVEDQGSSCYSVISFYAYINSSTPIGEISEYEYCEFETDGIGEFIFAEKDAEILGGQGNKEVLYFETATDAESNTNAIAKNNIYTNTSNPQTIHVRVQGISDPDCFSTASFTIKVGTSPNYNEPDDWFVCDDPSNDQTEEFDLSTRVDQIKNGIQENITVTLYANLDDAQAQTQPIDANTPYSNISNPQTIFARIGNGNACNVITSFELNVVQVPDANDPEPLIVCDGDYDDAAVFNLEDALVDILDVRQDNIVLSYFTNLNDLDTSSNAIGSPTNFSNTSNPQTVYVRLTNTVSNCYNAVPIELIVSGPPITNQLDDIEICRTENAQYDLSLLENRIIEDSSGLEFTFHRSQAEAHAKSNRLATPYNYNTDYDTIFVRTENVETGCYKVDSFNLKINDLPIARKPADIVECDDDFDGLFTFDIAQQTEHILGGQDPSQFSVIYFLNTVDGVEDINLIGETMEASDQQMVYAKVTNKNTGCYSFTDFRLVLNPLPYLDIGDQAICPELDQLIVSANTNVASDTYLWSTGETTPEINIALEGTYSVTVTTANGCQQSETFNVIKSEPATIETTETIDFSDPNNITITVSGIGNYAYQLDDNEPQDSNKFERVPIGYHTITIIDLNGCSSVKKEVLVIDAPKFMTPNGDGYWDYWHIVGIETLPGTKVQIFDRYGKRLAQLEWDDKGWDGKHNGRMMPATDYWYVADVKQGGFEFQVKGHFALRR